MFWTSKIRDRDERGKVFPFKMHAETDMEKYRADTFWTKEPETIAWIDGFKKGSVFIDVGANIGVYSLYAAKTKGAEVYAFEPMLENFTRLIGNVLLNDANNITPLNLALSSRETIAEFFVKSRERGASGSQINAPIDEDGNRITPACKRRVLAITLDTLVRKLQMDRPVYIKIDVDGHEREVLHGLVISDRVQSILIEINTNSVRLETITAYMAKLGLFPDPHYNHMKPHSSDRRKGNPINMVFTRPTRCQI